MIEKEDIVYVVFLKQNMWDLADTLTKISQTDRIKIGKPFYAKIVNQTSVCLYFETENNEILIVPHSWIYFMAPAKDNLKERDSYNEKISKYPEDN